MNFYYKCTLLLHIIQFMMCNYKLICNYMIANKLMAYLLLLSLFAETLGIEIFSNILKV